MRAVGLSTFDAFKHLEIQNNMIRVEGKLLESLQKLLVSMLDDFDAACEQVGASYMLGGGSCLGAVRHNGFIPWDDDLDINMTRSDFNLLHNQFDELLGDKYWLHVPGNTPWYDLAFARIRRKGTVVRCRDDFEGKECGAYIDIFFIDNTPDNPLLRKAHGIVSMGLGFAYSCARFAAHADYYEQLAGDDQQVIKTFKRKARLGKLFFWKTPEAWAATWDRWNSCCNNENSKYISIPVGRRHYFGELYKREEYLPVSYGSFEGRRVPLSAKPDIYMRTLYGDEYMTPPPDGEHEHHIALEFDLGEFNSSHSSRVN